MFDSQQTAQRFLESPVSCAKAVQDFTLSGPSALTPLRTEFGNELAGLIQETAWLQPKAIAKLGNPDSTAAKVWWVTRRSLQQATPWQVAQLKATWFGDQPVADLCCGVGGDSIALASRGPLIAVDRDPLMAAMAQMNLPPTASPSLHEVRCDDVTTTELPPAIGIHVDPDRREGDRRSVQVKAFSPTWDEVATLTQHAASAIIKLAPATPLEACELKVIAQDRPMHRCWISLQGSVREQTILLGDVLAAANVSGHDRSAISMAADGTWHRYLPAHSPAADGEELKPTPRVATRPQPWLIDPTSAIRAAGLTESFAAEHSLSTLGGPAGFLTSDQQDLNPEIQMMANIGRVLWIGSPQDRKLRRQFRQEGWFPQTIKCRSTGHDPAEMFRRYRDCGDQPVTLWLGRIGKKVYAAVTDSLEDSSSRPASSESNS